MKYFNWVRATSAFWCLAALALLGNTGCAVDANGGDEQRIAKVQLEATAVSPALPVSKVLKPSSTSLLLLLAPTQPDLFLNNISINRVTSGPVVNGTIFPGTATHPGHATLTLGPAKFDALAAKPLPFQVLLTYDDITFSVSDFQTIPPL